MTKNPVRPRGKHVTLSAEGYLANIENAKVNVLWDDVYIVYKREPHKTQKKLSVGKLKRMAYIGPCIISEKSLESDLDFSYRMLAQYQSVVNEGEPEDSDYTRIQHYENEVASQEATLKQLREGTEKFIIEEDLILDTPTIFVKGNLNRKTAEEAVTALLKGRGVHNPKLIWKRTEVLIWPC